MQDRYIYIVGQPDPQVKFLESIHQLGYKAGVLLDKKANTKNLDKYDRIEYVDYKNIDSEIQRLDGVNLAIAGVVCTYENYIIAKAKIGEHFNLPAISVASAQTATDKFLMRQAFIAEDPSITPGFELIDTAQQAVNFANKNGYPVMIKPTNLVKSLLVLKCADEQAVIANFKYAQDSIRTLYEKYSIYGREPQLIVEGFITGKSCSIAAFVDANGVPHFCNSVTKIVNAQDIGVNDNYLYYRQVPADLSPELTTNLFETAKKGIEALGMKSCPAHVELIYENNTSKLIEIGARIGGYRPRMYEISYGINLIEQEVRLAIGQQPNLDGVLKSYCSVYELLPDHEGAFVQINGAENTDDYKYYSVKAKPGQIVGPAKNGYKATAIIIVADPDKEKFDSICDSIDRLSVKLES